jgi:alkaline phosphatase
MPNQTRKEFLKTGALTSLFLGSGLTTLNGRSASIRNMGSAKNVIFMVSDGMSTGTLTLADVMLKRRDGRTSNWISLYDREGTRRGLMDMASADRIVTDSAAAAASWGCGHRVNNGALNIGPNGQWHKPILPVFRDAGKATGLVTTTELTHATPAGFAANVESRAMGEEIASQYLRREVDLLLGGGNRHYSPEHREDRRDLYSEHEEKNYRIVRKKDELLSLESNGERLLGVFANGHVPYTLDHLNTPELLENVPTLAEMTDTALQNLSTHDNGFILQIEGGRVDHAAHGNDVGGLLYDQIAFDDAIGVVLDFAENRDDTLVIITTDHGNANPGLNSAPDEHFDQIQNFTHTNSWIHSGLNEDSTVSQIRERVEAATGFGITADQADAYLQAMKGEYSAVYSRMNSPSAVMGQIIANYTHVNFVGGSHTGDYVELTSFGPGSEDLQGFVINTELFGVMTQAAGVTEYAES